MIMARKWIIENNDFKILFSQNSNFTPDEKEYILIK